MEILEFPSSTHEEDRHYTSTEFFIGNFKTIIAIFATFSLKVNLLSQKQYELVIKLSPSFILSVDSSVNL